MAKKSYFGPQITKPQTATMSDLLRSLRGDERSWANRSGRSPKKSEWVNCSFFFSSFLGKKRAIRLEIRWANSQPCQIGTFTYCNYTVILAESKFFFLTVPVDLFEPIGQLSEQCNALLLMSNHISKLLPRTVCNSSTFYLFDVKFPKALSFSLIHSNFVPKCEPYQHWAKIYLNLCIKTELVAAGRDATVPIVCRRFEPISYIWPRNRTYGADTKRPKTKRRTFFICNSWDLKQPGTHISKIWYNL